MTRARRRSTNSASPIPRIEVLAPSPYEVRIRPTDVTQYGHVDRSYEDTFLTSKRTKSVYLAVPAEETRHLDVEFADDEDFQINFLLRWSKGLPLLDRCFITRSVKFDSTQVKSRKSAGTTTGSRQT